MECNADLRTFDQCVIWVNSFSGELRQGEASGRWFTLRKKLCQLNRDNLGLRSAVRVNDVGIASTELCGNMYEFLYPTGERLAVWWMEGWPLPEIVERQIKKHPNTALATNIRNTLDLIETQIRFQAVRFFGCYISLLKYALSQSEWPDLAESIPSVPVFLEIGASDRTMVSFISLGLSRVAAMRLNNLSLRKDLDEDAALSWLRTRPLESLGLSPLLMKEIELILAR